MLKQRKTEWLKVTKKDFEGYYRKQFDAPYRSTVAFCAWLETLGLLGPRSASRVADVGAGLGGNIHYMAKRYPRSTFTGLELNAELVKLGNGCFAEAGLKNAVLERHDLYKMRAKSPRFDGLVSYQTLSWLPDHNAALRRMMGLGPSWIALTSLFYDGPVDCRIQTRDYTAGKTAGVCKDAYYNVYSQPQVQDLLRAGGYSRFMSAPFEIDIDLPRPADRGMGTYTERLRDGRRLQISGPVLMSWRFIAAVKPGRGS
ncbi:MAG: class I SAM-dependent methyltransferase [Elusimicrobiota bacterium]